MDNGEVGACLCWVSNRIADGISDEQQKLKTLKVINTVLAPGGTFTSADMKAFLDRFDIKNGVPRAFGPVVEDALAWQ
jgi:hypothetical protein